MMQAIFLLYFAIGAVFGASVNPNNFQDIIQHVNSLETTWKAGDNFGKDVTPSSIKRLLGLMESEFVLPLREPHAISDSDIPEEFDARKRWPNCPTISQIRDQGKCGSCWAVAAASAFSDRLCIATGGNFTLPLSEEEVLSCCEECGYGCGGGYNDAAWNFFAEKGIVTGGDYRSSVGCQPYEIEACEHFNSRGLLTPCSLLADPETPNCTSTCTNPSYETPYEDDHHRVKSGYRVSDQVSEIQKEIMLHGPVEAGFLVFSDFITYKSGVYQTAWGTPLGGHAVKIIGWGTENGTPYWLIVNSWNSRWGDNGLFKMIRGIDHCGIESGIIAGVPLLE